MTFFDTLDNIKVGTISLNALLSAVLVFVVCAILIKLIGRINARALEKTKLDSGLKSFISSALKAALWAIAVLIIADCLNIPIASLVAVLSVAGLALSLSIQGILSNLFSGITILGTRPFKGGDYVDVGSKSGTVRDIGLFYTVIITPDNKEIYVPNSTVASADIVNYSAEGRRRVDLKFSASYDAPTALVRKAILDAVEDDARILHEPLPFVGIESYGNSAVEYICRVWVVSENYWDVHFDLNEAVRESFGVNGVQMPYDQLDIHVIGKQ